LAERSSKSDRITNVDIGVNILMKIQTINKSWDDKWKKGLLDIGTGGKNVVEPQKDSSLIYICLKLISENFAGVPVNLYKDDHKIKDMNDPVYRFIRKLRYPFWERSSMLFSLRGEVFFYIVPSVGQVAGTSTLPGELMILDGKNIDAILDASHNLIGWRYNNKVPLALDEVIQIKTSNTFNHYRGMSPILALQTALDSDKSAEEYNKNFFQNSAMPSGIITLGEDDDSSQAELRKFLSMWNSEHGGTPNAKKTAILQNGMDYKPIGLSQTDMDFIQGRTFSRNQISTAMGVPAPLVGYDSKGIWNTLPEALRSFWSHTITPICNRFAEALNYDLLDRFAFGYKIDFDLGNIVELQDDYSKRCEQAVKLQGIGFSRNETNKRLNLGYEESEDSNNRYISSTVLPEDQMMEPLPTYSEVPDTTDDDKSFETPITKEIEHKNVRSRRILRNFLRKQGVLEKQMYGKLKNYFYVQRKKVLSLLSDKDKEAVDVHMLINKINIQDAETKRLVETMVPLYKEVVQEGGEFALETLGLTEREYILNTNIILKRSNMIGGVVDTVFNQIKKQINDGINAGETIENITQRIKGVYNTTSNRARLIARTETSSLLSEASLEEYKHNGVQRKQWASADDERVRDECRNADAQGPIPINQTFSNGLEFPSAVNCRCCIIPVTE